MNNIELKVARIGNSRGVRLPAATLERYGIGEVVIMEERPEGILLRPTGAAGVRLSWQETAMQMTASQEDWSDWESADGDGLASVPWQHAIKKVAEPSAPYKKQKRRRPK